jgi:uncharacterized protein
VSSFTDRLRGVVRPSGPPEGGPYVSADDDHVDLDGRRGRLQAAQDGAAEILDGQWHGSDNERFLIVDRTYVPGYRHGSMAVADGLPPSDGVWPRLSLLANLAPSHFRTLAPSHLLFIDLETTGLAGGAGTYAFLVGCGWFAGGTFKVRQFVLSNFAAERALLQAVSEVAEAAGTVVTYNGKSFDLPLIETRFTMHRMATPFADLPHIDMLHPARRLWRAPDGDQDVPSPCRLSTLEESLCGYVREGDVAGYEIPARYFRYVHSGDARPLAAVLEHNRLDLLSLAFVTARAAQLLDEGAPGARTPREALGLGRLYERGGMLADARSCFARAVEFQGDDEVTRAEALRAYAVVSRRMRQYDDAAAAWRGVLGLDACPRPLEREASEALAVHLEHRVRDPLSARAFALRLLQIDERETRRQATEHRLARLDRKLAFRSQQAVLF